MPNYRRLRQAGGTYFLTVTLDDRTSDLLVREIDSLRDAFLRTRREHPLVCDAMVVLPDHFHCVWTLPEEDDAFPERIRKIKSRFTRSMRQRRPVRPSLARKREAGLWQRRYWEHLIRDDADYRAHVKYCWSNPVKHGLVMRARDWPYSTLHRDIARGLAGEEW